MAWAIVARRALSPSTPRAQGAPLRASGVDRSARPSKWLSCQQCEDAPLGLPRSIFNRHPPEVSITEICYQFRVSHMGCSPEGSRNQFGHSTAGRHQGGLRLEVGYADLGDPRGPARDR